MSKLAVAMHICLISSFVYVFKEVMEKGMHNGLCAYVHLKMLYLIQSSQETLDFLKHLQEVYQFVNMIQIVLEQKVMQRENL